MKRTSVVHDIKVLVCQLGSATFVGDNHVVDPRARVLAVQRELPEFLGDEGNFRYRIFHAELPAPGLETPVRLRRISESPWIRVGHVKILSVSVASVLQVGSTSIIDADNRLKQFRQLLQGIVVQAPPAPEAVEAAFRLAPIAARMAFKD